MGEREIDNVKGNLKRAYIITKQLLLRVNRLYNVRVPVHFYSISETRRPRYIIKHVYIETRLEVIDGRAIHNSSVRILKLLQAKAH